MSVWKKQFLTNARIRRAVILHGNIQDVYWGDAPDSGPEGRSFQEHVRTLLQECGYQRIVLWSTGQGAKVVLGGESAQREWAEVVRKTVSPGSPASSATGGQTYAPLSGLASAAFDPVATTREASSFAEVLLSRFQDRSRHEPMAFIFDGGESLFGNANSLSEAERRLLLLLGQTLCESQCSVASDKLDESEDLLVISSTRLGLIPPRFYQDNPAVSVVHVPKPDREDRSAFLARCQYQLLTSDGMLSRGTRDFEDLVDSLDGFTFREMQQLVRLSRIDKDVRMSPKRLVQLFRYGESRSPWEDLSREKLKTLGATLRDQVKGQDHVLDRIESVVKKAYMGLSGLQHSARQQMPKGIFFFVGPTGVGKTETAKALARFLFGEEEACIRFDMSEYAAEHSDQRLVGAPPGYVGYEEGGQLTNAVRDRPFSVLLFDEIEKAHGKIFDKFLQILEDGRLTDGKGDTVSFSESVIVFTSNIGAGSVRPDDPDPKARFAEAVEEHFTKILNRPELLNRIGRANILPFNFLTDKTVLMKIIAAKMKPLRAKLKEKFGAEFRFVDEEKAKSLLLDGFDVKTGGRGAANRIGELVIDPLAAWLFEMDDDEVKDRTVLARVVNGKFRFDLNA